MTRQGNLEGDTVGVYNQPRSVTLSPVWKEMSSRGIAGLPKCARRPKEEKQKEKKEKEKENEEEEEEEEEEATRNIRELDDGKQLV